MKPLPADLPLPAESASTAISPGALQPVNNPVLNASALATAQLKPPYVIAVYHQKGGVAKTTTALSLGAAFAERGCQTLLVDLDPSGNLTSGIGIATNRVPKSIFDLLLGRESLQNVRQITMIPNLEIIPARSDARSVAEFLNLRSKGMNLLKDVFSNWQAEYQQPTELVIVDCPPMVSMLTSAALAAANLAIIPVQCEYYSLQALEGVFKLISKVRSEANPALRYRLLVTMFDQRGRLHGRILELVRQRHELALFKTIIGFDSKLRESQLMGVPITHYAGETRAAAQYRTLAEELSAYVKA